MRPEIRSPVPAAPAACSAALLALAAALGALPGCLSKSVPAPTRYFRPALAEPAAAGPAKVKASRAPTPLRIRRVSASSHLRDRVAVRVSEVEVGFDDLVRWTEMPAAYVERALAAELFERRPLARTESGSAARLDVEVRAFEELRTGGAPEALVVVWVSLADARDASLLERSFTARRPLDGSGPEALARAMGNALDEAVSAAAQAIEAEAAKPPPR